MSGNPIALFSMYKHLCVPPIPTGAKRKCVEITSLSPHCVVVSATDEFIPSHVIDWDHVDDKFWQFGGQITDRLNAVPAYYTTFPDDNQITWCVEVEDLGEGSY